MTNLEKYLPELIEEIMPCYIQVKRIGKICKECSEESCTKCHEENVKWLLEECTGDTAEKNIEKLRKYVDWGE